MGQPSSGESGKFHNGVQPYRSRLGDDILSTDSQNSGGILIHKSKLKYNTLYYTYI